MEECWKCGLPINKLFPSDGMMYASNPPKYAHAKCPNQNITHDSRIVPPDFFKKDKS